MDGCTRSGSPHEGKGHAGLGIEVHTGGVAQGMQPTALRSAAVRVPARLWLAMLMVGSGVVHLVEPGFYERIVPRPLGHARLYVQASGLAEIVGGLLLAAPRTRRVGGWAVAVLLVAVFPANVQMALDGGLAGSRSVLATPLAAWLRLPLQAPLVWWAVREGRRAEGGPVKKRSGRTAPPAHR